VVTATSRRSKRPTTTPRLQPTNGFVSHCRQSLGSRYHSSGVDARVWWCRGPVCYSLEVWCIDTGDADLVRVCGAAGCFAGIVGGAWERYLYECVGYDTMLWTLEWKDGSVL
jgi:hypothetical protein